MTILLPADKLSHFAVGVIATVAVLPAGHAWAAGVCTAVAVAREIYGCWRRGWRLNMDDLGESIADIASTLAGCWFALRAAFIGV